MPELSGHRDRLRKRLIKGGANALHDYELLEMLLFCSIPRRDVRRLAKHLLEHCSGSIASVINSTADHLKQIDGIGETSIATIFCIRALVDKVLLSRVQNGSVLDNWTALIDYLRATTQGSTKEHLRVIYMDKKYRMIDETFADGTVDRVSIYEREIIRHALYKGATSIVISHNHTSNDPTPSQSDIVATKKLLASCSTINLQVIDHIIMSCGGYFSFKENGMI